MFARNEASCIIGAIKEGLHFADNVWVIIDPDSTDKTEDVIRHTFLDHSRVHIEYQFKNDSMQDDSFKGKFKDGQGCIAVHWNMTYWINKIIPEGEWFHFISPDERYAPHDYADVYYAVKYAMENGYESAAGGDHLFIRDEVTGYKYDWCVNLGKLAGIPNHFIKKPAKWEKGLGIHTGYTIPPVPKRFVLPVSHYHFALVKEGRIFGTGPRDHTEFLVFPRYQWWNPMGDDWTQLNAFVDNNGKVNSDLLLHLTAGQPLSPDYEKRIVGRKAMYEEYNRVCNELETKEKSIAQANLDLARASRVKGWRVPEVAELMKRKKELLEALCKP